MVPDLIYDVGMHNGSDTAYYLARGYRVVAVEADVTLVDEARARFAKEVASGRLTLVNCAVGERNETATFWICETNRVWNSFVREIASREGLPHHGVEVRVRPFAEILKEHGVPRYLKVDIEGYDHLCIRGIDPDDAPEFLSWEMSSSSDMALAQSKGYNAFKCISQTRLEPLEIAARRGGVRIHGARGLRARVRKALLTLPAGQHLVTLAQRLRAGRPGKASQGPSSIGTISWTAGAGQSPPGSPAGNWSFPQGSSGPFGTDLPGEWRAAEVALYEWLDYWINTGQQSNVYQADWFDMHATRLPKAPPVRPPTAR